MKAVRIWLVKSHKVTLHVWCRCPGDYVEFVKLSAHGFFGEKSFHIHFVMITQFGYSLLILAILQFIFAECSRLFYLHRNRIRNRKEMFFFCFFFCKRFRIQITHCNWLGDSQSVVCIENSSSKKSL